MPINNEIKLVDNNSLLSKAKTDLSGIWTPAIVTFIVYMLVSMVAGVIPMGSLLIAGPLGIGIATYSLKIAKGEDARLENIFEGFQNFGVAIGTYLLMIIFIFLWMLLLIIPGIIKAISYSQVFYILAEDTDKELNPMEILKKSQEMMDGHKMDYFILGLILMFFALLTIFTFGIALFWFFPYAHVTMANFYLKVNPVKYQTELDEFLADEDDILKIEE